MEKSKIKSKRLTDLRKRAEETLHGQKKDLKQISVEDIQHLVSELQVHQIELEMQNEELRKAQNELEEAHNKYVDLYDFAPVGHFTLDKDGLILDVNLTGARLLDIGRSILIKQPFLRYVIPDSRGVFHQHLRKVFEDRNRQICEIKLNDKKGIQFDARLESLLVQDSEAKSNQCRTVVSDITEKMRMEKQLLRAQRMESLGTLAAGIAHNLNNVLTPTTLSLRMLREKLKGEQDQRLLNTLERDMQRGAFLIKQIMSFTRGIEGEYIPLQIDCVITEIETIIAQTFPKNIEIRTEIQKDISTISGDAALLHQLIMNLCVNACDAMPDGGILSITASDVLVDENYARMSLDAKVGSYIVISVSDTGTGISPEIIDKIFDPFFTTKKFGQGTGLGLSTSLGIVKSHGGFIDVKSKIEKGTTFSVYLPAIKTEMQNAEEQPELITGNRELILVVEDEDSIREITCSALETNGYRVLTANDGADAIAQYAQNIDETKVILMDLMMPVMDGEASIRAIRKINPQVKIIAVSGLAERDKLKNVADYTNAFLPKPYTTERILKTIHEILNSK